MVCLVIQSQLTEMAGKRAVLPTLSGVTIGLWSCIESPVSASWCCCWCWYAAVYCLQALKFGPRLCYPRTAYYYVEIHCKSDICKVIHAWLCLALYQHEAPLFTAAVDAQQPRFGQLQALRQSFPPRSYAFIIIPAAFIPQWPRSGFTRFMALERSVISLLW